MKAMRAHARGVLSVTATIFPQRGAQQAAMRLEKG